MPVLGSLVQSVENVLHQIHLKNSVVKGVGKKQTMLGSDSVDSIIHAQGKYTIKTSKQS